MEYLKALLLGIVEGITEWLPISSTGHMILVNEFINNEGFTGSDLFLYVIQLGAILAVVTMYFKRLNPFAPSKTAEEKAGTWQMWFKVVVACIPAAVFGLLLNDYMEKFENWLVVSAMLILYGIGFIFVESRTKSSKVTDMSCMSYKTAILIGLFQVLSIIPGTSRSGATILGAILMGCSRELAAEFSFFLAIPVMFGVTFLKLVTYEGAIAGGEIAVLVVAMLVAYVVSMLAIKFLVNFVKKHDFKSFGWYRIVLGLIVIGYFSLIK
ncbi:MAG: undecaprenyl-diphosphate phosphatase [Ruminococcaceae bacterium]|nr:undecaprenyl-diphosphate phosphatase [Oscillospiraceae bacterium]